MRRHLLTVCLFSLLVSNAIVAIADNQRPRHDICPPAADPERRPIEELLNAYVDYGTNWRDQQRIGRSLQRNSTAVLCHLALLGTTQDGGPLLRDHRLPSLFHNDRRPVPTLVELLAADNAELRRNALRLLGWLGQSAKLATNPIVNALDDPAWQVREQAAKTLGTLDALPPSAVEALAGRLTDVQRPAAAAAQALARHAGQARDAIFAALDSDSSTVVQYGLLAVGAMQADADRLLPGLLALLSLDDSEFPTQVVFGMLQWKPRSLGPHEQRFVRRLDDSRTRCNVAQLLLHHETSDQTREVAISVLVQELDEPSHARACDTNPQHLRLPGRSVVGRPGKDPLAPARRHALNALARLQPQNDMSLRAIVQKLADPKLLGAAMQGLEQIGEQAVPELVSAISSQDAATRSAAATTLARIGGAASDAVPHLVAELPRQTGQSRQRFLFALSRISNPAATAAVPHIRELLVGDARDDALSALARIQGEGAADLAVALVQLLHEQTQGVCPHPTADDDLRAIGVAATPAIVDALRDSNYGPKYVLATILDEFGTDALRRAESVWFEWLADERFGNRLIAAEKLIRISDSNSAAVVDVFSEALNSANAWTQMRGAEGVLNANLPRPEGFSDLLGALAEHRSEALNRRARSALDQLARRE